jgi:peptidyl-prolyl cis-trans isomerase B (cyclophilin B)
MAFGAKSANWAKAQMTLAVLLSGVFLSGCGLQKPSVGQSDKSDAGAQGQGTGSSVALDPRMHQSFSEATISDPPEDWLRPPDTTISGKSVGKLYTEVKNHWDAIRYVSAAGKPLAYWAVLETEMGDIEITFRPDLAPNHVRNFVALAQAGYYDGLVFERTIHEQGSEGKLELIEGGCPIGTGETGYGSIGYWMKSEINPAALHEEGTVGASHGEGKDTAACKFYITLNKSPFMDGEYTVFGKVTQGLGVARKILSLPVRDDDEFPEGDRPVKPVVIRKITIYTKEMEPAIQAVDTPSQTPAAAEH